MPEIYDFEQYVPFLKLSEVNDGDVVTFDTEGRFVDDKWGRNRLQIDILLPNKDCRRITVNKTSQRNLVAKYGNITKDWYGKCATIRKETVLIGGKRKEALILYPK